MYTLAIDTSNQVLGVAITKENVLVGEIVTNIAKNHSVRLMPAIDQLMKELQIKPSDLEKIVVAKGPGSYTGVRIGLTTAKTLAWALNIPIVGVSSLEVLAYQGKLSKVLICPFFDARRGLVYTGLYKWQNRQMQLIHEEVNVMMEDWLEQLLRRNEDIIFLSPDMHQFRTIITEMMGDSAIIPEDIFQIANPTHLALAGLNKEGDQTHLLVPNYLRLAEAEAKWIAAQKEGQ
ncbi:tRNA (adenosine(37)-N6)-threonylcarbamoyltransferase complex dimerization subunit type 1 TsaB [Virgibacillus soli]|uniref:tRNA (Adenosine(37)-N6)-threonylcarbamoyltransferase complex dimerization subunit type 1 TsaB n=1 Tax=Paracerasibacillus soli TaxID=480284 RepID=A0ABU5CYI5_9BACI|nr:tRNA (adenosine(37)-N6)-threonylcarbamoyltransferase complex dimerization subunit type 1 TsaB [Virgibacillus soli]MDY0410483.1 tRNA (adenosine(37)-N6)-threonylcarbamoyltransferase complex dimerization subunit type 1 TsaB [Virgibacillus soli]